MKRLQCEMCGSTELIKKDGVFVCQSCGVKYSVEEAKKLMSDDVVEIRGSVDIDKSKDKSKWLIIARNASNSKDIKVALKYYTLIYEENPLDWEGRFFSQMYRLMNDKDNFDSFTTDVKSIFKIIQEDGIDNQKEICKTIIGTLHNYSKELVIPYEKLWKEEKILKEKEEIERIERVNNIICNYDFPSSDFTKTVFHYFDKLVLFDVNLFLLYYEVYSCLKSYSFTEIVEGLLCLKKDMLHIAKQLVSPYYKTMYLGDNYRYHIEVYEGIIKRIRIEIPDGTKNKWNALINGIHDLVDKTGGIPPFMSEIQIAEKSKKALEDLNKFYSSQPKDNVLLENLNSDYRKIRRKLIELIHKVQKDYTCENLAKTISKDESLEIVTGKLNKLNESYFDRHNNIEFIFKNYGSSLESYEYLFDYELKYRKRKYLEEYNQLLKKAKSIDRNYSCPNLAETNPIQINMYDVEIIREDAFKCKAIATLKHSNRDTLYLSSSSWLIIVLAIIFVVLLIVLF